MPDVYQYIERAKLLLQQRRTNDAIKQLQQALEIEPDNDEVLAIYARCKFDQHDYDGGIQLLQNAMAIDPENSYYHYLLGFGFYRKDDNKAAIQQLETALNIQPYFAECYGLLGYVYSEEKEFEKGLQKANEGLAIDAENITCLNARSVALNKLRRSDEAIATMEDALAQDPENIQTHATIGWNYLEKGKHQIANRHFREALRIDPNYVNAKRGLKESLKSKIPPYKWLLQYSFWINNKAKKTRWIIPVALYVIVRLIAAATSNNEATSLIGSIVVAAYLLFVLTSWIINPIANFFLLFHKDGKYALDATEKYTSITVISSLLSGLTLLLIGLSLKNDIWMMPFVLSGCMLLAMAIPLGNLYYPLAFKSYGTQNKIALILVALGFVSILLAFTYTPAAIVTGGLFLLIFIINNWLGIFR